MIAKLFVYGTLKPGGRNYHLATGVTHTEPGYLEGYTLLHFDPEGYPAMVPGEGRVYGVVLTFADIGAALPALDALEGCDLTHLNTNGCMPWFSRAVKRSGPMSTSTRRGSLPKEFPWFTTATGL